MSKNIAKLVVKMKSKSLIDIETMGDGANQVFMAAAAVAHTVADSGKGNRKKAEAIMTVAKDIIDSVFEAAWKSEYGEGLLLNLLPLPTQRRSRMTMPLPPRQKSGMILLPASPATWTA